MTFTGGTIDRSVHQSVYEFINTGLNTIGWFDSGRAHDPIVFISGRPAPDKDNTILPNTVALADVEVESSDFEMGSEAGENKYKFVLEMYAQNEAVGRQLMGDVRRMLAGQYPGISIYPIIDLYDYSQDPRLYMRYMDVCDVKWSHPTGDDLSMRYRFKVEWCVTDYDL